MGTRADFYVGTEWLGSIAWDGYPEGIPDGILKATDSVGFRIAVVNFVIGREDGTTPDMGWPWPWDDSRMTDYAYVFDEGQVLICELGEGWTFPDMSERKNVTLGPRSGITIVTREEGG